MVEDTPDEEGGKKERAELFLAIADRAAKRFDVLSIGEWKTNFGVWTLFVAGTTVVITAPPGTISFRPALLAGGLGLFIAGIYTFAWLPYIQEAHQRNARCSFWWECMARLEVDEQVGFPLELSGEEEWPRPAGLLTQEKLAQEKLDQERLDQENKGWLRKCSEFRAQYCCPLAWLRNGVAGIGKWIGIHEAHVIWAATTWILAALLACALCVNASGTSAPEEHEMSNRGDYTPDNPDGSGDSTLTVVDFDGNPHEIPYHYEHLSADSTWEVATLVPIDPPHLNTYGVPGGLLVSFLEDMESEEHAETILYIRRVDDHGGGTG